MSNMGTVNTLSGILTISLASTVKGYHVNRAIEYYKREDLFFVFAHEEDWPEPEPPATKGSVPSPEFYDQLLNPWAYKKVESKWLVKPDDEGSIVFQNKKFKIYTPDNALENGARWLYLMSYVSFNEIPLKVYRQIGLNTGVVVDPTHLSGGNAYTPDQILNPGVTEIINNRIGVGREPDLREMVSVMIEF